MRQQIIEQPDGRYAVFDTVTDTLIVIDATAAEVIVLSQLNDDGMMRESRAIKNDASVVIVIERPDADEPESPRAGEFDLKIEKNRFGPCATVTAAAKLHYSSITGMGEDAPAV